MCTAGIMCGRGVAGNNTQKSSVFAPVTSQVRNPASLQSRDVLVHFVCACSTHMLTSSRRLGCRQAFHPVWIWYRMKAYEPGTCRHLILKLAILVAWGSCEADHYGSHLPIPGTPSRNLLALLLRVQTLRHRPSAKHQHRYALLHFIKHLILFRHRLAHDAPIIIKLGSAHLCVSLMAIMHCRQRMRTQALPLNESYAYLGVQGLLLAHQSLSQSKAERTLAVSR